MEKQAPERSFVARLLNQTPELLSLAVPIILSRTGVLLMITADTVMLGHFATRDLAVFNIGTVYIIPLLVISLGLLMGTLVMTVSRFSLGEFKSCGEIWRKSIPYALFLSLISFIVALFGEDILLASKQAPDLARDGGTVMLITAIGVPAHLLFLTTAFFLEGIKRPTPVMVVMVFANILNFVLNWTLIFGHWGAPEMGVNGAVLATSLSRWFLAVALILYVLLMPDQEKFAVRVKPVGGWHSWIKQRRIGYAIGISVGVETIGFAVINIFAGWLGEDPLASFSIVFNLIAIIFMAALGIGSATAIKVGYAFGQRRIKDMAMSGWAGLVLNSLVMMVTGAVLWLYPENVAAFYSTDPVLIEITGPLIMLAAFLLIFDGGQAVMNNALRGCQDVWLPTLFQTFNFLGIMVPVGWYLAFPMKFGVIGLVYGILVGSFCAAVVLSWRFHLICKRHIST